LSYAPFGVPAAAGDSAAFIIVSISTRLHKDRGDIHR